MGRVHAHVRPHVRPHVRSPLDGPYGATASHDGISFQASTGRVVIKAPGAAPTVTTLTSAFTFTGGNQSYYRGPAGLLTPSVTNTPRIEYGTGGDVLGLLMEGSAVNQLLQNRDFTNASWAKTTMTAAKDQTGADGSANGASSLTATAGNATALQTIVQAAVNSTLSFDIQRITGTGAIGICQDGVTFTDVTAQINSTGYTRVTLTASQLNPVLGIRLVTSGDKIAVDFSQFEAGAFATSRIPTAGVSVLRTADACTRVLGSEFSATAGTVVMAGRASGGQDAANGNHLMELNNATAANRMRFFRLLASDTAEFRVTDASVTQTTGLTGTFTNFSNYKAAMAWAANDFAFSFNGGAVATDAAGTIPTITTLCIGSSSVASDAAKGHIRTFDYYPSRLDNATLQQRSA